MRIKYIILFLLVGMYTVESQHSLGNSCTGNSIPDDETGYSTFFNETDVFLKKYVSGGKVDYKAINNNKAMFDGLVEAGSLLPPSGNVDVEKAYWINMYNLLVIRSVIMNLPGITSPIKVDGFFSKQHFRVRGKMVSLDDIEKKKLLPVYNDPRIHFVLVCAANGCPPLKRGAYYPASLEKTLESQTKKALNDPAFVKVNSSTSTVGLSELMKWYKNDFLKESSSLISYINRYRVNKIPENYKISYYTYDWTLNSR